jgi:hypothetical protein
MTWGELPSLWIGLLRSFGECRGRGGGSGFVSLVGEKSELSRGLATTTHRGLPPFVPVFIVIIEFPLALCCPSKGVGVRLGNPNP